MNVYGDMTCANPKIDIFELLTMRTPRNVADTTELTIPANRAIVLDGIKFQSEYLHDPSETRSCPPPTGQPSAASLIFVLTIWEAIMLLPLGQGSTAAPAYLPNIAGGVFQDGDTADRVLWKRLNHLRIFGLEGSPCSACPFLEITDIMSQAGPQQVKTRCRIDDRHGLFYVRNYVHDIFLGFPPDTLCGTTDCDACGNATPADQARCGSIPILNDAFFKLFYHVR